MIKTVVEEARKAQAEWSKVSVGKRSEIFLRFSKLVLERQAELITTLARPLNFSKTKSVGVPFRFSPRLERLPNRLV
jgi:acyl-CoA reductase-like NAD-dependent aldehyde dehydrogenase